MGKTIKILNTLYIYSIHNLKICVNARLKSARQMSMCLLLIINMVLCLQTRFLINCFRLLKNITMGMMKVGSKYPFYWLRRR